MIKLPSRQVHLDFHTSEAIGGIGAKFSKANWQQALKLGRLNSITIFAKCHHGWSYYPTQLGAAHPHLKLDLMGRQIAASHEIGVRAPIYYTVGWSVHDAVTHPEWVVKRKDGSPNLCNIDPKARPGDKRPMCSWAFLCPNGGYLDLIRKQTEEICREYPVDGFFYDICCGPVCYCDACQAGVKAAGLDPDSDKDAAAYNVGKWQRLMAECNRVISARHPEATIFYNSSADPYAPQYHGWDTHFELEDLPTTWGGYDRFPLRARFFANTGKDALAMSGKFHTTWGEFGGFKHPDAIRFEAACMIAYGARCSFGDQLHPCGEMDLATYKSIGQAYRYVERIESYGLDGEPVANLGLWLSGQTPHDQGVANMLLESQIDFLVVEPGGELGQFDTIILTGDARLNEDAAARLEGFVKHGGKLLVLGTSGLDAQGKRFLIDVGAEYLGPAKYELDYLRVGKALGKGLVEAPFLCYTPAVRVKPARGGQVLAAIREPYFDRTYEHYCSHQNTPYQLQDAAHPGAVRQGGVVYLPHPLGQIYHAHGARLHRDFFINALRLIYKKPLLAAKLPSAGRATLIRQPDQRRYVLHLMYAPPLQRGRCLVIEDLVPLYGVPVQLRLPEKVRKVYLAPERKPVRFQQARGIVKLAAPTVQCHQAIVLEW